MPTLLKEENAALHVFRVEAGEHYWYVAESAMEAAEMFAADEPDLGDMDVSVFEEPDDEKCAVKPRKGDGTFMVLAPHKAGIAEFRKDDPGYLHNAEVRTYKGWVRRKGKGFLGSTV